MEWIGHRDVFPSRPGAEAPSFASIPETGNHPDRLSQSAKAENEPLATIQSHRQKHRGAKLITLRSLFIAFGTTLGLAFRLPQRMLSRRFSAFEPQQAAPHLPRSLIIQFKLLLFLYPAFFLFGVEGRYRSMRKAIYDKMARHLKSNATRISAADPLAEVDLDDLEAHLKNFYDHPTPFVVRNYNSASPAIKNWSLEWFSENYGDFLCSSTDASDHTPQKLSSLLSENQYVNFLDRILRVHPELKDHVEAEAISTRFPQLLGIEPTYNELFISGKSGSGSGLHNHSVWNFFLQIAGQKEWTLVDPEFSHLVYALSNKLEFGTQVGMAEGSSQFPLYEFCPRYKVTLNPGDLLFNPPMWWHRIENRIPEADPKQSVIGITFKYYNSARDSETTFSDARFNRFNEIHCLWRGLFLFRYARFLSRPRTKYTVDDDATECPVQARLWAKQQEQESKTSRWKEFRYLCLNDPEANEY